MQDKITLAIDALASAAFVEGGVSPENTQAARDLTEQRKRELLAAIGAPCLHQIQGPARSMSMYASKADYEAAIKAAPAAVAVPDAVRDAETLLRAEAARLDRIYGAGKWYGFSAEKASHLEHLRVADALAATPAADAKPFLSEDDLDDLRRFEGMASDGESYDIAKKRMKRLAELGVVRWVGGSRYCMTAFGQYVLKCWDHLPLEAHEEANARVNAEFRARIDRLNAEAITAQAAAKEGAQQG